MKNTFFENWKSGITVSLVSLPLAVSLAVASQATPVAGIVTAIWAGLIAALFGGSNYNVIGPTGALSGILAAYVLMYGAAVLPVLAILSGIFIFAAYLFRLERYLIFFPASTIHGFILGIAFIIMFNQVPMALGLTGLEQKATFFANVVETGRHLVDFSGITAAIFCVCLAFLFFLISFFPRVPAVLLLTIPAILLGYLGVQGSLPFVLPTLGAKFPDIRAALFLYPHLSFSGRLIMPALTIALISILETMISARIADGMTKTRHNKRREMLGLSLANIGSGLAGGIPATAALARTALNVKTGCTHRISAALSSVFVAVLAFIFLPIFSYIPLVAIAAILVFVSLRMIEHEHFIHLYRVDRENFFLAIAVALITVLEDPMIGLLIGALISTFMFMRTLSDGHYEVSTDKQYRSLVSTIVSALPHALPGVEDADAISEEQHKQVLIYTIKGELAYINSQAHVARFEEDSMVQEKVVINLKELFFIDHDGVEALGDIVQILQAKKKKVALCGATPFVLNLLMESPLLAELKKQGLFYPTLAYAIRGLSL